MTVTLILPNEEEIKVRNSLFETSELVTNLLIDTGQEDVSVEISPIYASMIDIYLEFLHKIIVHDMNQIIYPEDLPVIDNTKDLFLCFLSESFFADNAFFKYLMKETYKLWNEFLPDVRLLPDERLFYLYTPYEFLPEQYLNTQSFFKEWLEINANKDIVLNGNEVYHTKMEYYPNRKIKKLKAYHTVNNKDIGYRFVITWRENGHLQYKKNFKNGKPDGLHEGWYENGHLQYKKNFKNGKLDGLQEGWYENGQPEYKQNFKNSELNGLEERWYRNGQPKYKRNYKDGKLDGLQEGWYENGQPHYKKNYKYGKEDGLWEGWYENGQLHYQDVYDMGKFI